MGGYQSVDSGRGPAEETVRGGDGAAYGAQQHPGLVESQQSQLALPASLGELQGEPHHQLHQHVEHDVLVPAMDKLVGEEPPDLLPLAGVVDQVGTPGGWQHPPGLLAHQAGDMEMMPDVESDLTNDVNDASIPSGQLAWMTERLSKKMGGGRQLYVGSYIRTPNADSSFTFPRLLW